MLMTGCVATMDTPLYLETPGPVAEHFGSVSTTKVNGVETEKKTLEEETVMTPAMAELKLKLAALEAQVAAAKASSSYRPSYGGGYYGGGAVITTGSGGYNRTYSNGGTSTGGVPPGGNTGTVTIGSGGTNTVYKH